MALVQCEQYEPFWRKHRDDWRPCTPDDVWGLREDRTFQPPSKAHVKRLMRERPAVTTLRERQPIAQTRRRELAQAQHVAKSLPWNKPYEAHPVERERPLPMPDGPRLAPDHAVRRAECIFAECVRIAAYGVDELSRAFRLYRSI